MKKLFILAVLVIGMMASAQAQDMKKGQVYTVDSKNVTLKDLSKRNVKGIRVIKEKNVTKGKDKFVYLTLETKGVLIFKNGVLIGGIK